MCRKPFRNSGRYDSRVTAAGTSRTFMPRDRRRHVYRSKARKLSPQAKFNVLEIGEECFLKQPGTAKHGAADQARRAGNSEHWPLLLIGRTVAEAISQARGGKAERERIAGAVDDGGRVFTIDAPR